MFAVLICVDVYYINVCLLDNVCSVYILWNLLMYVYIMFAVFMCVHVYLIDVGVLCYVSCYYVYSCVLY